MPELTSEIADAVAQACRSGADEAAAALGRALDTPLKLAAGDPQSVSPAELPEELAGPGLAVLLAVGPAAALLLVPESTGLVPNWAPNPDPTGRSKLTTLAQELAMVLLPEEFLVEKFDTLYLTDLADGVRQGSTSGSLALLPLELTKSDGGRARIWLVWPVSTAGVLGAAGCEAQPAAGSAWEAPPGTGASAGVDPAPKKRPSVAQAGVKTAAAPFGPSKAARPASVADRDRPARQVNSPEQLPSYARSLLHIQVPVMVTLAQKRQSLSRILELGPGSIIQFDKSCEEPLCLEVAGRPVALGEAVKVGEKFGLRITAMILPGERFQPLHARRKPHGRSS